MTKLLKMLFGSNKIENIDDELVKMSMSQRS